MSASGRPLGGYGGPRPERGGGGLRKEKRGKRGKTVAEAATVVGPSGDLPAAKEKKKGKAGGKKRKGDTRRAASEEAARGRGKGAGKEEKGEDGGRWPAVTAQCAAAVEKGEGGNEKKKEAVPASFAVGGDPPASEEKVEKGREVWRYLGGRGRGGGRK